MPLNFDPLAKGAKTQDLQPVHIAVYSILAWQYKPFMSSFEQTGSAYFNGNVEYYDVSFLSSFVVKYKEDMDVAEAIMRVIDPPAPPSPEYDPLADAIFDGTDHLGALTPPIDDLTIFVLSTYTSTASHPFILNNVLLLQQFHPNSIIHVVDNGSLNRDHVSPLRALFNVVVHELETTGYELGAYSYVYKRYRDVYPGNPAWVCMQDQLEPLQVAPLRILESQVFLPFFYFTYPLFDLEKDVFESVRMEEWVKETLAALGMEDQSVRSAVFTNSFATTSEGMKKLSDVGLFDVVIDEKMKSQACERLLGGVMAHLGYEPFVYGLAFMGMTVSKARPERVAMFADDLGGAGGYFKKLYVGAAARGSNE